MELASIIYAIQSHSQFFMSKKFTILTDHVSHVYVWNLKFQHGKLYRWALRLQNYVFDIKHIKGSTTPADFISRTVERLDFCARDFSTATRCRFRSGLNDRSVYAKQLYPSRTLCAPPMRSTWRPPAYGTSFTLSAPGIDVLPHARPVVKAA